MSRTAIGFAPALLAALTVIAPVAPAQAANPGYCHHYADLAVWQFKRAIGSGCIGGPSLRWNADWGGHYSWCLGADEWVARREDDARGGRLHACFG